MILINGLSIYRLSSYFTQLVIWDAHEATLARVWAVLIYRNVESII
jgi:hypothetical protein